MEGSGDVWLCGDREDDMNPASTTPEETSHTPCVTSELPRPGVCLGIEWHS